MLGTLPVGTAKALMAAWQGGSLKTKIAISISLSLLTIGTALYIGADILPPFEERLARTAGLLIGGLGFAIGFVLTSFQKGKAEVEREQQIAAVEKRVQDHPKETQAAWQLARVKLESYLDRNLSQVRSIFWLTAVVMTSGFSLIFIGAYQAFMEPNKFKASVLTSISGVVVSFIGGTFLVLYKSTMTQAKDYVTILERINAVGMSVQILDTLDDGNKELKHTTIADVARQLLMMYSTAPLQQAVRSPKPRPSAAIAK
jgi:TRADD-N domain-containing protein